MQAKLKQWSLHAVYENEADGQVAHILSILIGASWGVFLFVILIGLYDNDWKVTTGTLVGCVLLIVPLELLRRQRLRASSLIFVLIVLGTVTLIATVRLGIRDLAIVAFPIVLILAGLILSRGLFRLCVGLTVLAVCWLAMGETNGWFVIHHFNAENSNWFYLIGVTLIVLATALSVDLLATNARKNLEQAQREIAEHKRAEEVLHVSEERFRALIENSSDAIALLDANGIILFESQSASRILGYSRAELTGHSAFELVHPDDLEKVTGTFATLLESPISVDIQFRLKHKDGSWRWVEAIATNMLHLPAVQAIVINYRDITERKQAEDTLRERERQMRALVISLDDIVFEVDEQGTYRQVWTSNEKLLPIPKSQLVGKNLVDIWGEEMGGLLRSVVQRVLGSGNPETYEFPLEIHQRTLWSMARASPILVPGETPKSVVVLIRDITERKRAEEESRRANALVEEAHRELQQAFAREQRLARTDALTGVNNRRYWFDLAEHEFVVATRYRHPLAVILFDIDHFKLVNDTFGHAVGDQVLERVAQVARAALRSADVIGRYGGEEFIIVLPMTTAPQAYLVAERIRADVGAIRVETAKGQAAVTLSIGIAEMLPAPPAEHPGGDDSVERVIQRADEAMYAAKAAGRNRTSIHSAPAERPGGST